MRFLPTTLYLLTFQALVVVALPQDELGPQGQEDPAALEILDIPKSQVEFDKESQERIYQGRDLPSVATSVMSTEISSGGDAHASTL
ncbi:uncharacterized protein N7483_012266 [Penicillium malachiteum]|uniref:uncharacterized protein n=1 Tax=Penicillium malachiteum TaxID=1324776 RepID=UPI0025491E09|nr:uncharacterized protein N7483_012266 [Penicillium malachiteum]KAJ5715085.1 hypothetical protein N7483_012266 [Penicillium malachiteum]